MITAEQGCTCMGIYEVEEMTSILFSKCVDFFFLFFFFEIVNEIRSLPKKVVGTEQKNQEKKKIMAGNDEGRRMLAC